MTYLNKRFNITNVYALFYHLNNHDSREIVISTTSTDSYIIKTIITIYEKKNLIKSHIKKKKKKYIYWV